MTKKQLQNFRRMKAELKWIEPNTGEYMLTQQKLKDIEDYVANIDDAFTRFIFRLRYIVPVPQGYNMPSWSWVASQVHASEDYCKNVHSKFCKKNTL